MLVPSALANWMIRNDDRTLRPAARLPVRVQMGGIADGAISLRLAEERTRR